jgi:hypothetical protein
MLTHKLSSAASDHEAGISMSTGLGSIDMNQNLWKAQNLLMSAAALRPQPKILTKEDLIKHKDTVI